MAVHQDKIKGCCPPRFLIRDKYDSEASFVSHHPSVSFRSICQWNGFDHRADSLQRAEGERVLRIYRRSGHRSRNRTRAKKKCHRIDLDWFISSGSGDNELAAWSKSSEKWRHGLAVCGCSEDQSCTAQGLKCGHGILGVAVNVMMCLELLRETFLFWPASTGCALKAHAACNLNPQVT